jgi:hypothetical protein
MAQSAALARVGVDDAGNALNSIEYPDGAERANGFLPSVRPAVEIDAVNQIEELKRVTKCQLHPASDFDVTIDPGLFGIAITKLSSAAQTS